MKSEQPFTNLIQRTDWRELSKNSSGLLSLDKNENCDAILRQELEKQFLPFVDSMALSEYPDVAGAYYALSEYLNLSPDRLFLANGSEQAIRAILYAHSQMKLPASEAAISFLDPTFGMVDVYGRLLRYSISKVAYQYSDGHFVANTSELLGRKGLIYLANPDNPTGSTVSMSFIKDLCEQNEIVLIDEAYIDFALNADSIISLVDHFSNLYVIRTFSKSGGVAGLRIGYVVSQEKNILRLQEERPMYQVNGVACEFLKFIVKNPSMISTSTDRIKSAKVFFENWLNSNDYAVVPCDGNFSIAEFSDSLHQKLSSKALYRELKVDGHRFIRVTIADSETMRTITNS